MSHTSLELEEYVTYPTKCSIIKYVNKCSIGGVEHYTMNIGFELREAHDDEKNSKFNLRFLGTGKYQDSENLTSIS